MASGLTRDQLLDFMQRDLRMDTAGVTDDTLLFSTSRLDSMGMISLITFVETTAGVRFEPHQVTLENLDSIERILKFAGSSG